jgi:hypothetical protein
LEKIKLYAEKNHYFSDSFGDVNYSSTESNYTYKFVGDNFVIGCDVERTVTNRYIQDKMKYEKEKFTREITIPFNKLNNKFFINDGFLVFSADYNAFIVKDGNKSGENKTKWHGFRINIYGEEQFVEKFNRAMFHLLTFVKKSKAKDLF